MQWSWEHFAIPETLGETRPFAGDPLDLRVPATQRAWRESLADQPTLGPVDVVGSLCENNDKFAINRRFPKIDTGDILVIHDTGAHGHAMGFNYNGHLRPKELLLKTDGSVELIRRAETMDDYFNTLNFEPRTLTP